MSEPFGTNPWREAAPLIKNERQYRITRLQAEKFSQALGSLARKRDEMGDIHPRLVKAQEDALRSQLADLEAELKEYESLRAGNFSMDQLRSFREMPEALIRARIAQGITQKQLAERLGLKEQQVQRYEATEYDSASLSRIKEVINALTSGD